MSATILFDQTRCSRTFDCRPGSIWRRTSQGQKCTRKDCSTNECLSMSKWRGNFPAHSLGMGFVAPENLSKSLVFCFLLTLVARVSATSQMGVLVHSVIAMFSYSPENALTTLYMLREVGKARINKEEVNKELRPFQWRSKVASLITF